MSHEPGVLPVKDEEDQPARDVRMIALRIAALVFVIAISILVYAIRDQTRALAQYGYGGVFLLSLLSNATVILPAPGVLFVFAMGSVLHPAGVALAAATGASLGELSGYLAGFSGQAVIENREMYQRIRHWILSHRFWAGPFITLLAFQPLPFFDLAGIAAGALRIPLRGFLFWCFLGKLLKMLAFAYAGAYSLGRFS